MPKPISTPPDPLRPFIFHGLPLDWEMLDEATCDCPNCGRGGGKFSVNVATGEYKCFVCDFHGGSTTFMRWLWEQSDKRTASEYDSYAADRGLLYPETLIHWGACVSLLSGAWLFPAYNPDGALTQLYKRIHINQRWEFRGTATIGHAMHGLPLHDPTCETIYLCEKPSDGMSLWEILRIAKIGDNGHLTFTGNSDASLAANASVLTVANTGAMGEPFRRYLPLFAGKRVVLCFDHDHPKEHNGEMVDGSGLGASKRAAAMLTGVASEVQWIAWLPDTPHNWDVRDAMKGGDATAKIAALENLLRLTASIPVEWQSPEARAEVADHHLRPMACHSWPDLLTAWDAAAKMRDCLIEAKAVMLAVVISTVQQGEQVFLQLLGPPGGMKTKLCEALLVSQMCYRFELVTGFVSGWKSGSDTSGQYSLLNRINGKTLITPEGDVIASSRNMPELMSHVRRLFDGSFSADFKTLTEQWQWHGLRTPMIWAGTPAIMRKLDQAQLGDRFLKFRLDEPVPDEEWEILMKAADTAFKEVTVTSNCSPESQALPEIIRAKRMTGGYVDHLRREAGTLLASIARGQHVRTVCGQLAKMTAYTRSGPETDLRRKTDEVARKELPARLIQQFCRLAACLAAVTGRREIDEWVLRALRKVAADTSDQRVMQLCGNIAAEPEHGAYAGQLAHWAGVTDDRMNEMLRHLSEVGTVERCLSNGIGSDAHPRWRLSSEMRQLWNAVHGL